MSIVKIAASIASIRRAAKLLANNAPGKHSKNFFTTLGTKGKFGILREFGDEGQAFGKAVNAMNEYSPEMQGRIAKLTQKIFGEDHTKQSILNYLRTPLKGHRLKKVPVNFTTKFTGVKERVGPQIKLTYKTHKTGPSLRSQVAPAVASPATSGGGNGGSSGLGIGLGIGGGALALGGGAYAYHKRKSK